MKIVHISKGYNHGGAGIACKRLVEAQRSVGLDATVITQEKGEFPNYVYSTTKSRLKKKINFIRLAFEKFIFLFYEKSSANRFLFSLGNIGESIAKHPAVKNADIINLHWINGGFISIKGLRELLQLNKPVVWTMHDMWSFTGGCHYAGSCNHFQKKCGDCLHLNKPTIKDISAKQFKQKEALYNSNNIFFTSPSKWLKTTAEQSSLLKNKKIDNLPNAVPFLSDGLNKKSSREALGLPKDKNLILFGAFNIKHERKGLSYLIEALEMLSDKINGELVIFGKQDAVFDKLNYKVHSLGYQSDPTVIAMIYNAADIYVIPTLEDNLPNTVLESLACNTPVVAFNTGGIPDMVDHKINGYVAEYKNSNDLANGISWSLNNRDLLLDDILVKITSNFSFKVIGNIFKEYYSNLE